MKFWVWVAAVMAAGGLWFGQSMGAAGAMAPDSLASPVAHADSVPPELIALGERLYGGKVGGAVCATCHGPEAKGIAGLGPDLTDGTWLHGDGSLEFLMSIIRSGVAQPKSGSLIMPPYGGTPLNAEQLRAVAAYIRSLNR